MTHIHTLHYITLHYITLHYITLHYITLHYITLHYITLHYITLHYILTYLHTYIYTYRHTHIHTHSIQTCNHTETYRNEHTFITDVRGWPVKCTELAYRHIACGRNAQQLLAQSKLESKPK